MSSLREFLTRIANAIRNKKGTTAPINAQNFASEIESIETGGGKSAIYKTLEKMGNTWSLAFYNDSSVKSLFYYMTELKESDFPPSNNVTAMGSMFNGCNNLATIPQLDTSKVTYMSFIVSNCHLLPKIDITRFNIEYSSSSASMFVNCYSLRQVIIRSFGKYSLNFDAFNNCYHLDGTVNETYNPNGDKDCYIYVPRDMVDTLKSATNWSAYASQIRALEDYTVDGTTTGDLDESKI